MNRNHRRYAPIHPAPIPRRDLLPAKHLSARNQPREVDFIRPIRQNKLIQESIPSGSIAKNSSSVRTRTLSCSAFCNLLPAPGPATT